jgi:predicted dinucleotide-binding enzyme
MNIGIIGSGALGSNVARAFAAKGISATIANKSGPASLAKLVGELGSTITAGTIEQAASADIVVVAVPWEALETLVKDLPAWSNRIVIDATNPVLFLAPDSPDRQDANNPLAAYGIKAIDLGDQHASAIFSKLVPGARVVKAFNHVDANVIPQPEVAGGQRTMFYAGDDAAAKAEVRTLLDTIGYFPVDLGSLDIGGPLIQLPFGPLAMSNFAKV